MGEFLLVEEPLVLKKFGGAAEYILTIRGACGLHIKWGVDEALCIEQFSGLSD